MHLTDNMRGALYMTISMAAFVFNDTCVKLLSADLPLFQTVFLRGALTVVLILFLGMYRRELVFRFERADWAVIAIRTFAELGATVTFLTALFHMPLANITAILQSLPLAITFAGALFFGEKVGWRRYLAIAIGFAGVLLIVRPGSDGFDLYSVLALVAVCFVVLRDLITRKLSPGVPSLTVAFITSVAIAIFGGLGTMFEDWVPLVPRHGGLLLGASVFIIGGYLFSIMVMRVGEISFVAPFRYTALISALVIGVVVFGEFPDTLTLIGSLIVIGMGLFSFHRERQLARSGATIIEANQH